jgi:precorrin-4/cobalt-precorrin-4 C11-methyltransferase
VSHPEEKIIYTKTKDLVKKCEENKITRHALIIAGKCVEAAGGRKSKNILKSKLYDAGFSHGYRDAKK